jgi:V8-like Glu-specific endopeptidase
MTATARQIFYWNDTRPGSEGAPVYTQVGGCTACALGINAYGLHGTKAHRRYNHGTRITDPVADDLERWRAAPL